MKRKIIGILIMTLLIATTLPVSISVDVDNKVKYELEISETSDFDKFSSNQLNSFDVDIVKPEKALYLNDEKLLPLIFFTLIFGSITVEAEVSGSTTEKVEFLVDDVLRHTDYSHPFIWKWDEKISLKHTITVKAYDQTKAFAEKTTSVWIFNQGTEIISPKVWITDPLSTDLLYEPTWDYAVVTEEKIILSAVQIGGSEEIAYTIFDYSLDGSEWIQIGMDTNGEFQGFVFEEEENPPWYGGNKRIGDEGWKTEWNNTKFSEGDYFLRATMTDITGVSGSCIRKIHIDRTPPKPIIESPHFGERVSGMIEFRASSNAENIVSMEVKLFHGSPGWFNQTGLGNARQKPGDGGICAPTAAANALAGLGEKKVYPPGQDGNDSAVQEDLIDDMGTDKKNGTNCWKDYYGPFLPPMTGMASSDQMGDAIKAYLQQKGIGCSNDSGYDVKVYSVTITQINGTWGILGGSNKITFEEYSKQIRLKQVVILVYADYEVTEDKFAFNKYRITFPEKGGSHAVTGRGTNSEKDRDDFNEGSVMDTNGQNKTIKWTNATDYGGGNVSMVRVDGVWKVVTGMWVICPKNKDAVVHSLGVDMNPEGGFAVAYDTTSLEEDGTFTFIIEITDSDGYIGTDAIVIDIDNTPEDNTPPNIYITDPQDGAIVTNPVVIISGYATDYETGIAQLDYSLEWDGGIYNGGSYPIDPPLEYVSFDLGPINLDNYIDIGDWITITTYATDVDDNTGSDTVTVTWEEDEEDTTPPITKKTIGEPQWEEGYTIASFTPILLEATDPEPGSGVNHIHYEVWQDGILMGSEDIPGDTVEMTFGMHGVISGIAELRWYAVDNAENVETTHYQEHFILY